MKVVYDTGTNVVVGDGDGNIDAVAPHAVADAPANYKDHPRYFWIWNGVDAVVLKVGQDLIDAQNQQKADTAAVLIDRYTIVLGNALAVVGSMEAMLDINNQIVQKLMNGTEITQDEKDAYNLAVNTCAPKYKLLIADITQAVADAMLAKKAAARQVEVDMKNDPDWPY